LVARKPPSIGEVGKYSRTLVSQRVKSYLFHIKNPKESYSEVILRIMEEANYDMETLETLYLIDLENWIEYYSQRAEALKLLSRKGRLNPELKKELDEIERKIKILKQLQRMG